MLDGLRAALNEVGLTPFDIRLPDEDPAVAPLEGALQVRAHGGRCRVCWQRVRRGEAPLRAGERYRPQPDATEQVHEPDCVRGGPLSASAVREVHFEEFRSPKHFRCSDPEPFDRFDGPLPLIAEAVSAQASDQFLRCDPVDPFDYCSRFYLVVRV